MIRYQFFKVLAIAIFALTFLLIPHNSTLADTIPSETINTAKQAAQEVLKDTGAKQQFGKNQNGDQLIDNAKAKASKKVNNLAEKADTSEGLVPPEKQFLKNLQK